MTKKRLDFGKKGEQAAASFLKKQGYRILKKNFSVSIGEIDLIAEHKDVLVFIEVKSRTDHSFGHPSMAVTRAKQKKIVQTAQVFLMKHPIKGRQVRFDVVSILPGKEDPDSLRVEVLQDAFRV
ncbi:MAG: YraN family protein [Nitrospinae bacterium]|jgi:putative endonuclease|nr:YraN family protein [Nitrospinota bacterium]